MPREDGEIHSSLRFRSDRVPRPGLRVRTTWSAQTVERRRGSRAYIPWRVDAIVEPRPLAHGNHTFGDSCHRGHPDHRVCRRWRRRRLLGSHHLPTCPNDHERPQRQEFASRGAVTPITDINGFGHWLPRTGTRDRSVPGQRPVWTPWQRGALHPEAQPCSCESHCRWHHARRDAVAPHTGGVHPDEVRSHVLDPRLEPSTDDRHAFGLGIQMMRRPPCQHEPPLARF
jgi:hypothetical protein